MSLIRQNIEMFRGETKRLVVTVTDSAGQPVQDLDVNTFEFRVWQAPPSDDKTPVIELDETGDFVVDEPNSKVTIELSNVKTVSLEPGEYYHELKMIDVESNENIIMIGALTLNYASKESA